MYGQWFPWKVAAVVSLRDGAGLEHAGGALWRRRGGDAGGEGLYPLSPAPSTLLLSGSGVPAEPHSCSTLFTQGRLGLAFCTTEIWQVCVS